MTPSETILFNVLLGIDAYGTDYRKKAHWTRCPNRREDGNAPAWDFINCGVHYDPAQWLEKSLDAATTKAYSRALVELEEAELVLRERRNGRTTHLQLTVPGLEKAIAIAGDGPDLEAIALALSLTRWAPPALVKAAKAAAK